MSKKKLLVPVLLCLLLAAVFGGVYMMFRQTPELLPLLCERLFSPPTGSPAELLPAPAETPVPSPAPAAPEKTAAPETQPLPETLRLELGEALTETAAHGAFAVFSEGFDGAIVCPPACRMWTQNGKLHFEPADYFARIMLSAVEKDSPDAPRRLDGLLDTEKWGATADSTVVGAGRRGLCMRHLKYDTYRYWIVWETPTHYVTLYGACFDEHIDELCALMEELAASFRATEELIAASCAPGALLLAEDGAELRYAGAAFSGSGEALTLELRFAADNPGERELRLAAEGDTPGGTASLALAPGEGGEWRVALPLVSPDGAAQAAPALELRFADSEAQALKVEIEWK